MGGGSASPARNGHGGRSGVRCIHSAVVGREAIEGGGGEGRGDCARSNGDRWHQPAAATEEGENRRSHVPTPRPVLSLLLLSSRSALCLPGAQIRFHEEGEGDVELQPVLIHTNAPLVTAVPTPAETVAASASLAVGAAFGAAPINSAPALPTAAADDDDHHRHQEEGEPIKTAAPARTRQLRPPAGRSATSSADVSDEEIEPPRKLVRQGTPMRKSSSSKREHDREAEGESNAATSGDEADTLLAVPGERAATHASGVPLASILAPRPILHNAVGPRGTGTTSTLALPTMGRAVSEQTHVAPSQRKGVRFLAGSGGSRESDSKTGSNSSREEEKHPNGDQELGSSDDIRHRGIPDELHWVYRLLDPSDLEVTFLHCDAHPEIWTDELMDQVVHYIRPHDLTSILVKALKQNTKLLDRNVTISFRNLSYTDDLGRPRLQGITGYIRPKMMMCVLGGPDAGITTFLDVLAGRQKGGEVSGELLCDGLPFSKNRNRVLGYLTKFDTNLPTLTVRETLQFAGTLRSKKVRPAVVNLRVNIILKFLGMLHVAESIVGNDQVRGISGGEKRRLSYACEIVAGHSTVIADLPTNGLDSASAYSVLSGIQKGCLAGRSMACSLVQPSPELFRLFSHVMVLSKGAQLYFGPATQVELYFGHHGFKRPKGKELPDFLEELSTTPGKFYVGQPPSPVEYLQRIAVDPAEESRMVDIDSLQATAARLSKSSEYAWAQVTDEDEHMFNCTKDDKVMKATIEQSVKTSMIMAKHGGSSAGEGGRGVSTFRRDAPPDLAVLGGGGGGSAYKSMAGGRLPSIASVSSVSSNADSTLAPSASPVAPSPLTTPPPHAASPLQWGAQSPAAGDGADQHHAHHLVGSVSVHPPQQKKLRGLKHSLKSFILPDKDLFDVPFEEMDQLVDQERQLEQEIRAARCSLAQAPPSHADGASVDPASGATSTSRDFQADEKAFEYLLQRKWVWMVQCYRRSPVYSALGQRMFADMLQPKGEPKPYVHEAIAPKHADDEVDFKFHSTIWQQIWLATWRQWLITVRNPAFTKGALIRNVVIGLLIGSLFYMIGTNYQDARTRFGLFYFCMTCQYHDQAGTQGERRRTSKPRMGDGGVC